MGLLRSLLLRASTDPFLAERLPRYRFVRRAARRFMPGETPDDALGEAARLGEAGAATVLTLLGENVTEAAAARRVVDHYLDVIDRIDELGLDCELSVKPTQLGLDVDPTVAADHLEAIVEAASEGGGVVWIDMEASPYVEPTLTLFRRLREGHANVGVCLQAYLRRTPADLESLLPLRPAIRLVKGAYRESPSVAFPRKVDVDGAFFELGERLLRARADDRVGRPAIATHDMELVRRLAGVADESGLGRDRWEVAMLYGIATSDQRRLLERDLPLRVLISYGSHWFPWYVRRLAERPANLWFVARKMVGL